MMKFEVYQKGTNVLVDTIVVHSEEEVLEDYDYGTDFYDIKRIA